MPVIMSSAEIHKLLETKPYDVETIAPLEQFVSGEAYDFEADHALLKLYQFHPSKANKAVIGKVLARALAKLPAYDFTQHLYLIPESTVCDESVGSPKCPDFTISSWLFRFHLSQKAEL